MNTFHARIRPMRPHVSSKTAGARESRHAGQKLRSRICRDGDAGSRGLPAPSVRRPRSIEDRADEVVAALITWHGDQLGASRWRCSSRRSSDLSGCGRVDRTAGRPRGTLPPDPGSADTAAISTGCCARPSPLMYIQCFGGTGRRAREGGTDNLIRVIDVREIAVRSLDGLAASATTSWPPRAGT